MVKFNAEEGNLPKVDQILGAAKDLFWKYGIKRVTVGEICSKAGVSKVTFYKYFDHKIDLAIYLLDATIQESLTIYRQLMSSSIPFEEKVRETIRMKLEGTEGLSDELVKDILDGGDDELRKYYTTISGRVVEEVVNGFAKAQKNGEIRQDLKVEFMLFFMGHMIEMASDKRLLGLYQSSRELVMELLNFFFYGIMPRNGKE